MSEKKNPIGLFSKTKTTLKAPKEIKVETASSLPMPLQKIASSDDILTSQQTTAINIENVFNRPRRLSLVPRPSSPDEKKGLFRSLKSMIHRRSISNRSGQDQYAELLTPDPANDDCDIRFFIIRHAERVDRYFGPKWFASAFNHSDQYRAYHQNMPPQLPTRSNTSFWTLDSPVTASGLKSSEKLGRTLATNNFQASFIYSSPAMRCMLTTTQILKGLGLENQIPIRIEPGLLELGSSKFGMNIFYQAADWEKIGVNIDKTYQPIFSHIPAVEREDQYYTRSKQVIREIEKRHENSPVKSLNILIIAHATSPETLTWDLIGKEPNINELYKESLNIAYLQTVVVERKQNTKAWSLKAKR